MFGISYHTISIDSKQSPSRETLPDNNKKRDLARMWEGCNNKSNRPVWLEFRSSKWLIGWTAAVAAFTVCGLYYIFFVNFLLGLGTVEEGWEGLGGSYAEVISIGWLHIFGRTFCCLIMMSFGSCLPIQNNI